jgi:hypothetical protein
MLVTFEWFYQGTIAPTFDLAASFGFQLSLERRREGLVIFERFYQSSITPTFDLAASFERRRERLVILERFYQGSITPTFDLAASFGFQLSLERRREDASSLSSFIKEPLR